jgi:hypothetical protein
VTVAVSVAPAVPPVVVAIAIVTVVPVMPMVAVVPIVVVPVLPGMGSIPATVMTRTVVDHAGRCAKGQNQRASQQDSVLRDLPHHVVDLQAMSLRPRQALARQCSVTHRVTKRRDASRRRNLCVNRWSSLEYPHVGLAFRAY